MPARELEFRRIRAGRRHQRRRNGVGIESASDGRSKRRIRLLQAGRCVEVDERRSGQHDGPRNDFDVSSVEEESAGCPVSQLKVLDAGGTAKMRDVAKGWSSLRTWKKARTAVLSCPEASNKSCRKMSTGLSWVTTWQHCGVRKMLNLLVLAECCVTMMTCSGAKVGRPAEQLLLGVTSTTNAQVFPSSPNKFSVSDSCWAAGNDELDSVQQTTSLSGALLLAKRVVPGRQPECCWYGRWRDAFLTAQPGDNRTWTSWSVTGRLDGVASS